MAARNHIELIVKSMNVLETLSQNSEGASLKEIAARVGLVKSSVFRILFTLREIGYVEQSSENGLYRLTFKTTGLVRRAVERPTLINIAKPRLAGLRDELQESVWLAERRQQRIVLIDVAESPHQLKLSFDVGDPCPIHATALGKAIAAHLDPKEVERMLPKGQLPKLTRHTLTNRAKLKLELARVRQRGYAVNDEESLEGAILVAAPLFDSLGQVFAGISVSSPTVRCSANKRRTMVEKILTASRAITKDLYDAAFKAREK